MTVLNIHGYGGAPHNSAYTVLSNRGYRIVSPAIDYDRETPDDIVARLYAIIESEQVDLIVGVSLGGFFAAVCAAGTRLPVVLINPCLLPFLHLPRLGYTRSVAPFLPLFGTLSQLERDRVFCIVGGKDEVIDTHDFARNLFSDTRITIVPDGRHSGSTLPLDSYFASVLPAVEKLTAE